MIRCLRLLVCCLLLAAGAAPAREVLDLDVSRQPILLQDWGDYLVDPTGTATADAIARRPRTDFRPTWRAGERLPLAAPAALWVRITVPATPDDQRWYVTLPSARLDLLTLYTRRSDGSWAGQSTGDRIAAAAWPVPHRHPVLPLAITAEDSTHYLLRIEQGDGLAAPLRFVSETQLAFEQQRQALGLGMVFGLLGMTALAALVTAVALRDTAWFAFGGTTACATLAGFAASGLAALHLWPHWPRWADAAPYVLAPLALAGLLIFVAEATLVRERRLPIYIAIVVAAAASEVLACALWLASGWLRLQAAIALGALLAVAVLGCLAWSRRRGDPLAGSLMLALLPLLVALAVDAAGLLQWMAPWAHADAAVLAGGAVAVSAGYLLLALRGQDRRDHRRRVARLAEIDPATGLANETTFGLRLAQAMLRSARDRHQSVVALVDLTNLSALRSEFGREQVTALQVRLGERITSIMRNLDVVGRLDGNCFGVLVEGPVPSTRVRPFCAKLIGHCITPVAGLPQGLAARPRVVAALVPACGMHPQAVLRALRERLAEAARAEHAASILVLDVPDGRLDAQSEATRPDDGATGPLATDAAKTMPVDGW